MKKFEIGKYYAPAISPSINPLKCTKVTDCFVWFFDEEKEQEIKVKKKQHSFFNGHGVETWEEVKIYGYTIRAIDD